MKRLALLLCCACGYQPVYGATTQALCVRSEPPQVPDFGAAHALMQGASSELARAGAFGDSRAADCIHVELLRVQEAPTGIAVEALEGREHPRAAGAAVLVLGRAWLAHRSGAVSRDTGDMSRSARSAYRTSPIADSTTHRQVVQEAAERLGRALARRVLGLPEVTHEQL